MQNDFGFGFDGECPFFFLRGGGGGVSSDQGVTRGNSYKVYIYIYIYTGDVQNPIAGFSDYDFLAKLWNCPG